MILVAGVILIGIVLILLEILVLPGMIAGIVGALLVFFGIYMSYSQYGAQTGNITLATSVVVLALSIYGSFRSKAWNRFGLKQTIEGKVNDLSDSGIKPGDEAHTLSALRPSGTIAVNNRRIEAHTNGEMIASGQKVVIVKVLPNKVIVKAVY